MTTAVAMSGSIVPIDDRGARVLPSVRSHPPDGIVRTCPG
jgi:hypothetical protein